MQRFEAIQIYNSLVIRKGIRPIYICCFFRFLSSRLNAPRSAPSFARKVDVHFHSGDGVSVAVSLETLHSSLSSGTGETGRGYPEYGGSRQARAAEECHAHPRNSRSVLLFPNLWLLWPGVIQNSAEIADTQEQPRNFRHIQASAAAFAAILESGAVVICGHPEHHGGSRQARAAEECHAHPRNSRSRCVLLFPNLWLLWPGEIQNSAEIANTQQQPRNFKHIQASAAAFAAILESGRSSRTPRR